MRTVSKIIYILSIAYIALCCLVAILLTILPLELKNEQLRENRDSLFFFGIPIAILFTLARLGFKNRKNLVIWKQIVATVLLSLGVFILFFLYAIASFGGSMCKYTTGETVFTKRNSSTTTIVKRYFGCGATDSTPPIITLARQTAILSFFWYYSKTDSTGIDRSVWMPVK
ncbi:MAG: hypothetical protein H7Y86_11750 [Rhizobacter sp.]|nr:hypothetical protein [Ferruginibacter sp.]